MPKTSKDIIYGITVYDILTDNKIPYQLTFERDLFIDRTNVSLIPLINPQKSYCKDLKGEVIKNLLDFFTNNPDELVYIDIDIFDKKNKLTLYKFLKWMEPYLSIFNVEIELTKTDALEYVEIFISKIKN